MTLELIEVTDEELEGTRGGRGHGEYDSTLAEFLASGMRGAKIDFDGVKANSIKASLKSAIKRAVEKGTLDEGAVEVRGKTVDGADRVYLVKAAA